MKFWISLFVAAVFSGGACLGVALDRNVLPHAQGSPRSSSFSSWGQPSEMSVTRFATALELTEEQNAELDRILGDANRDIEAYRRAIRSSTDRSRERVTAILSESQRRKLDELVAAERAKRDEADIERRMKIYTSHLALTESQTGPFRQVLVEARKKRNEYFTQGKHGDHGQTKEFFKALRAEQEKSLESVLSTEQMKKYREISEWD